MWALGLAALTGLVVTSAGTAPPFEPSGPCHDFRQSIVAPLVPPLPLVMGQDAHAFGTYASGVDWASGRVVLDMPIEAAYTALLDHRNVKDMARTTLATTALDRPGYLAFHLVDVVVTVRALFVKVRVAWTEAWGFALAEGTAQAPRRIVASYQKVAGTSHIRRECGSYVLQALEPGTTDLAMYEEVQADHRTARDTSNMHRGIVANLRQSARQAREGK